MKSLIIAIITYSLLLPYSSYGGSIFSKPLEDQIDSRADDLKARQDQQAAEDRARREREAANQSATPTLNTSSTYRAALPGAGQRHVEAYTCADVNGENVCVKHLKSTTNVSDVPLPSDGELVAQVHELETQRQQLIGSYYDEEKSNTEQATMAAEFAANLAINEQMQKLSAIQQERDAVAQQMLGVVNDYENDEPFYTLQTRLAQLNEQYSREEKIYNDMVAGKQQAIDAEVAKAEQVLNGPGNGDWELFQLAKEGFSDRLHAITQGRAINSLTPQEQQQVDSIEVSMVDLENMAIAVAGVKHTKCVPYPPLFGGTVEEPGDGKPTEPQSYGLFRAAAATYIAGSINNTSGQVGAIQQITALAPESTQETLGSSGQAEAAPEGSLALETNKQVIKLKAAAILMQQQIAGVDLKNATKQDALDMYKAAYDSSLMEFEEKKRKLQEIDALIEGLEGREEYNSEQEEEFNWGALIAAATGAILIALGWSEFYAGLSSCWAGAGCALMNMGTLKVVGGLALVALGIYLFTQEEDHSDREDAAAEKLAKYKKLRKVYEKHGHLICHQEGIDGLTNEEVGRDPNAEVITYIHTNETLNKVADIMQDKTLTEKHKYQLSKAWINFRGFDSFSDFGKQIAEYGLKVPNLFAQLFMSNALATTPTPAASGDPGVTEAGIGLQSGSENFEYFKAAKIRETYNSEAENGPGAGIECLGVESIPRGQVQAFPYPCHRTEYLSKLVSSTASALTGLDTQLNTAIERRNIASVNLNNTRNRLSIRSDQATGDADKQTGQTGNPVQVTSMQFNASSANLNPFANIDQAIKKKQESINASSKANGGNEVNFAKRATQLRINSRRQVLDDFLKNSKKSSPFANALKFAGGSFNKNDVAIADGLNKGGGGGGRGGSGVNKNLKNGTDKDKKDRKRNYPDIDKNKLLAGLSYKKPKKIKILSPNFGNWGSAEKAKDNSKTLASIDSDSLTSLEKSNIRNALSKKGDKFKVDKRDSLFKVITKTYYKHAFPVLLELED